MEFTIGWVSLAVAGFVIEGIALFNSRPGDTLSEHLWAWLGIKRKEPNFVTPKWTLRVVRTIFVSAMLWFILHITTGGWV